MYQAPFVHGGNNSNVGGRAVNHITVTSNPPSSNLSPNTTTTTTSSSSSSLSLSTPVISSPLSPSTSSLSPSLPSTNVPQGLAQSLSSLPLSPSPSSSSSSSGGMPPHHHREESGSLNSGLMTSDEMISSLRNRLTIAETRIASFNHSRDSWENERRILITRLESAMARQRESREDFKALKIVLRQLLTSHLIKNYRIKRVFLSMCSKINSMILNTFDNPCLPPSSLESFLLESDLPSIRSESDMRQLKESRKKQLNQLYNNKSAFSLLSLSSYLHNEFDILMKLIARLSFGTAQWKCASDELLARNMLLTNSRLEREGRYSFIESQVNIIKQQTTEQQKYQVKKWETALQLHAQKQAEIALMQKRKVSLQKAALKWERRGEDMKIQCEKLEHEYIKKLQKMKALWTTNSNSTNSKTMNIAMMPTPPRTAMTSTGIMSTPSRTLLVHPPSTAPPQSSSSSSFSSLSQSSTLLTPLIPRRPSLPLSTLYSSSSSSSPSSSSSSTSLSPSSSSSSFIPPSTAPSSSSFAIPPSPSSSSSSLITSSNGISTTSTIIPPTTMSTTTTTTPTTTTTTARIIYQPSPLMPAPPVATTSSSSSSPPLPLQSIASPSSLPSLSSSSSSSSSSRITDSNSSSTIISSSNNNTISSAPSSSSSSASSTTAAMIPTLMPSLFSSLSSNMMTPTTTDDVSDSRALRSVLRSSRRFK